MERAQPIIQQSTLVFDLVTTCCTIMADEQAAAAIPTVASYIVPAEDPSYRSLGVTAASAINHAILLFDQLMAKASRDDVFLNGPTITFRMLADQGKADADPELVIKENIATFSRMLLLEKSTRKVDGKEVEIQGQTIQKKIRHVAGELSYIVSKPKFDANDEWMQELYKNFANRYDKNREAPTADSLAALQVLPLFGVIEPNNPAQMLETDPSGDFVVSAPPLDMRTIIDGLMTSNNNDDYALILMLMLTRAAVGRPGENQFMSYKYMAMERYFKVLMARWFMPKQLKIALVVFAMDFKHFQLCVFCGFAFYWIMGGLYRSEESIGTAEASYVFPMLRRKKGTDCSRLETAVIQRFVTDSRYKRLLSSRSIRISGSNVLAANPYITDAEAIAAGGWSDGTNMQHYLRCMLALLLAPARALAHWFLPREEHFMPDLSALSQDERKDVKRLIGFLYPTVRVEEFMGEDARHWDFMVMVTTVLLFRYTEIRDYYGRRRQQCPIVHCIVDRAKTAWALSDAASADCRLESLSKKLQHNFQSKLEGRAQATYQDQAQATATIVRVGDLVSSFRGVINNVTEELAMLRASMATVLAAMASMQASQVRNNVIPNAVEQAVPNQGLLPAAPVAMAPVATAPVTVPTVAVSPVATAAAPAVWAQMMAAQNAISRGLVSTAVKDDKISDFLIHLYRTSKLLQIHNRPEIQLTAMAQHHSSKKTEGNKIQRCLELVDCLFASEDDRKRYTACAKDHAAVEEAEFFFKTMDDRAVQAVVYLEGKMNEPIDTRRRPNVKGIGNKVIAVKEKLESWKPHWVNRDTNVAAKDVISRELVDGKHPKDGELFGPFIGRFFAMVGTKKRGRGRN
jgi:hypothetical protein